jgi:cysteine desulfurase/selenocysteine lyase
MYDVYAVRKQFPILDQEIHGKPLVYLDNGATTQKPLRVIEKISEFYSGYNSNIHRGVHTLSNRASEAYEESRELVREYISAEKLSEVVFTQGTTESVNLVARSFGDMFVNEGDQILVSQQEHHSNFLPWQALCERKNAELKIIPVDQEGTLVFSKDLLTEKTRLVAVSHVSNVLGAPNPVKEIIAAAHERDIPVLVDGAQAVQHMKVDVKDLDCDFYVFSGHKMYGPTGIGILYGKEHWLEKIPPFQYGGGMIESVSIEKTVYAKSPLKFEAGTPNYVAAGALAEAVRFINELGIDTIQAHEESVLKYGRKVLAGFENLKLYGNPTSGTLSFNIEGIHPYDAGMVLDRMGVAVRTGTHCAEPLMRKLGISGTMRASLGLYNTKEDIDRLAEALEKAISMLS